MYFSLEWLDRHIAGITDPKERIRQKIFFIGGASNYLYLESAQIAAECVEEARAIGYRDAEITAEFYTQYYKALSGEKEALLRIEELEKLVTGMPLTPILAFVYQMLGFFYWGVGKRAKAFECTFYVLKESEEKFTLQGFGWTYFQLGVFYFDMKDYDASLDYFTRAKEQAEKFGEVYGESRALAGIAGIYIAKGQFDEAMPYNMKAMEGFRQVGHKVAESRVLNDLGVIFAQKNEPEKAEQHLREALALREDFSYTPGIITSRCELARILISSRQNLSEAETLLLTALQLCEQTASKQKAAQCHTLLSELYRLNDEPWKALEHLDRAHAIKAEVTGEETSNRINALQQKFATDQADQEAEIHRLKNVELKKAYSEIEEKNKSITDSIHYARRIQRALLASSTLLGKHIPEHFVLYRPKDIVSGDFYWATKVGGQEPGVGKEFSKLPAPGSELIFLAACDCTGHGVPGAFMSLLNASFLNETVIEKGITAPAEILGEVRKLLVATLNPEGSEEETRDGMDATLLVLDAKTKTLSFACANNPLLLVRGGALTVYGPDKFPVGIHPGYEDKPFTPHTLALQPGDCIYLLTDGFADQFGGPQGKKFKLRRLKELLAERHAQPMREQAEVLEKELDAWKGGLEQVDDVLVIGFRV